MKAIGLLAVAGVALVGMSAGTGSAGPGPELGPGMVSWRPVNPDQSNELIERYCTRCHNDRRLVGNFSLDEFDAASAHQQAEVAERMIRKLRAGMMPPPGARRPEESELQGLAGQLEGTVDEAAALAPRPGTRTFQRLNQAEYAASVRDLLALDIDPEAYLPPDTKSANFDNIADVQMLSPTLMDAYLNAAAEVSRLAVGDPGATATEATYKVPRLASQTEYVEGAPFGTRGGLSVVHTFPADGEYRFRVLMQPTPTGQLFGRTARDEVLEISIDGERVAVLEIERWMSQSDPNGTEIETPPVDIRAGPHRVSAAFLPTQEGPVADVLSPIGHSLADTQIGLAYGITTVPHLRELRIGGPLTVTGVSDTPSRREIFRCRPTAPGEEEACAERIITRLATRAFRRPIESNDLTDLMAFYRQGEDEGGFEAGIGIALQAILASPHFLFRIEELAAPTEIEGVYALSDLDLATRLSFFLWGSPPDDELLSVADEGRLSDPDVMGAQVERMLASPAAEGLGHRFAAQWLRLSDIEKVHPDALRYPDYDTQLAEDLVEETIRFFNHLVAEDRSVLELMTADYTFVNQRLAQHYDIPGVAGVDFEKVQYPDDRRRGLLGHGSVLTLTSHANRTSPVLRGKWVMEVLLGTPPPPPPPNVPGLEETGDAQDGRFLSVREQMEMHRANPSCNSCHSMIDPLGLALENYDVTGRWRIKDSGNDIDVGGELYDGTPLTSVADLRTALLSRPDPLLRTFTENLMAYALGRRVEYYDMPTVRSIVRQAAAEDYRISAFITGIVQSPAFTMKADLDIATIEASY
ncbi:MAG: DUF1592 domain-containing protein [Gemmatimonadetes bacterium]|nr:DUF1592 domain-containing protein [Gemmatimonadota bacterium]NNK62370.1 DUF1592 domain-containing protein [Gemmatimonadota bacterium]